MRGPIVEQYSPVYWFILWTIGITLAIVGIWAMCTFSPNEDMEYAQQCLKAHGSYSIQDTSDGANRTCMTH